VTSRSWGSAKASLEFTTSRHFSAWLAESRVSIAFTTRRTRKLFLVGLRSDGRLSIFERSFERCRGLCATGRTLYMSTRYQIWRLQDSLEPGHLHEGYDRLYIPQLAWTTGEVHAHDVMVREDGAVVFANTLFSCLASVSSSDSFVPQWTPPFVSTLAPEDRCHLNGLALLDGNPRYATAVARSDVPDGWRDQRRDGGVVLDVDTGEPVATGLSMPHSPRLREGKVWVLDSGRGYLGYVDLGRERFEPVVFGPGYLRGLAFVDRFAVAGLSHARNREFEGLVLERELARRRQKPCAGIQVVDVEAGEVRHWLRVEGMAEEVHDVALLRGVRCPMALGFRSDEIRRIVTIGSPLGEQGRLL